ncbi:MAG: hypothetical protein MRERC_4c116 [Mycoplasmataceae bacterium RC_NB112A]|nr:MAG: hypothetical protein MRERC_4c116 [Mycoplasmataceae bacterium RC_NB112A]
MKFVILHYETPTSELLHNSQESFKRFFQIRKD